VQFFLVLLFEVFFMKNLKKLGAGVALAALSVSSAFAVDVSGAIADVQQAATDIESVGLALLAATVTIVVISFIRRGMARV
jgi:hypothetical protein